MSDEFKIERCKGTIDLEECIAIRCIGTAIDESMYTTSGFCEEYGISRSSLRRWVLTETQPNEVNQKKIDKAMSEIIHKKKMKKHPSFGYATEQEIERLKTAQGAERNNILAAIKKRTKNGGKLK